MICPNRIFNFIQLDSYLPLHFSFNCCATFVAPHPVQLPLLLCTDHGSVEVADLTGTVSCPLFAREVPFVFGSEFAFVVEVVCPSNWEPMWAKLMLDNETMWFWEFPVVEAVGWAVDLVFKSVCVT